jgi:hypothetical protein
MSETDPIAEAVYQLEETQATFIKAVRWRTWAIAGWAVAAVLLIIVLTGYGYAEGKAAEVRYQTEALQKLIDQYNRLAVATDSPERVLMTYGQERIPAPGTVTTVPAPAAK